LNNFPLTELAYKKKNSYEDADN